MHEETLWKVVDDHQQLVVKEAEAIHDRLRKIRESNIKRLETDQQERMEAKIDDVRESYHEFHFHDYILLSVSIVVPAS